MSNIKVWMELSDAKRIARVIEASDLKGAQYERDAVASFLTTLQNEIFEKEAKIQANQ